MYKRQIYILLDMCSSAAFIILPILIGFTAAREFGGNPYLGATLGGILTHPALTNAWGVAAGFQTMNFFGFEIALIGYQGTVFPVLLAVWFMSIVEQKLRRFIPDALDLILTPFLTVVISGFIALLIIGPAGRALGDGISFVLSTLIEMCIRDSALRDSIDIVSSNFRKAKKKKGNFPREREVTFLIISGNWI